MVVLVVGIVNFQQLIRPRMDLATNKPYHVAMNVAQNTEATDLILTNTDDLTSLTIIYFTERWIIQMPEIVAEQTSKDNWIAQQMEKVKIDGGRVLLVDEEGILTEFK
jgi:hypothetical protein